MNYCLDNQLIAEFMTDEPEVLKMDLKKAGCVKTMHYHDQWHWLIPVLLKIDSLIMADGQQLSFKIEGNMCVIRYSRSGNWIIYNNNKSTIKAVYDTVVQFIKWYNLNKKEGGSHDD